MASESSAEGDSAVTQKQYVGQVRVRIHSDEIEDGFDLSDWDDRKEAEIESEDHVREYRQTVAATFDGVLDALGDIDLKEVAENAE